MRLVNVGDAGVCFGGVREAALEVAVDRGRWELCGKSAGVLGFGTVAARVVNELVNGGLGAVSVIAMRPLDDNVR